VAPEGNSPIDSDAGQALTPIELAVFQVNVARIEGRAGVGARRMGCNQRKISRRSSIARSLASIDGVADDLTRLPNLLAQHARAQDRVFGCLCSLRARSALDGVSWGRCDLVEIAVGLVEPQLHNRHDLPLLP
jgi:hypothetical protein